MTIPARTLMAAAVFFSAGMLPAQTANQSSAQSPYYGSVTIVQPTDGVKPLDPRRGRRDGHRAQPGVGRGATAGAER